MNNKLIFFPSLSSGNSCGWLKNNRYIKPGLSSRFYEKGYPEELYHPYFLLSAGHRYREDNIRTDMGLNDAFVIGDSGGFQIATGAIKWKSELRVQIFNWLENNSDIAMNIDIPTRGIYANHFNEALNLSLENFKYFNEHQTGKTKYLNVLQGMCESKEMGDIWYNAVKDFNFHGWAFGGVKTVDAILYTISYLLQNKELDKLHNKYLHYLGATSVTHIILLTILQKVFNKRFNNRYQLCTDSSSPNLATIFGTYYTGVNWNSMSLNSIKIGKKHNLNLDAKIPCSINCKICNGIKFEDINKFDEYHYMILTHHNMAIYKNIFDFVDKIFDSNDEIIQDFLTPEFYKVYQSIQLLFESDDPMMVYNNNLELYRSFGYNDNTYIDMDILNAHFDIESFESNDKKNKKIIIENTNIINTDNDLIDSLFD